MSISVRAMSKAGTGPSSSHTVGLFGSPGATGHGHGSVKVAVLGPEGETPEPVDPADDCGNRSPRSRP